MSEQHRANGTDYERGCRCDTCRVANTNRTNRRRHQRRAMRQLINGDLVAPLPPELHGRISTYANWDCRCPACRAVGSQRNAADRARRQANQRHHTARNARWGEP